MLELLLYGVNKSYKKNFHKVCLRILDTTHKWDFKKKTIATVTIQLTVQDKSVTYN